MTRVDERQRLADQTAPADRFEEAATLSGTRVVLYAAAILTVVAALFYGMSGATNPTVSNAPAADTARQANPVRDVTSRSNSTPGTTTGAAPSRPESTAPAGAR